MSQIVEGPVSLLQLDSKVSLSFEVAVDVQTKVDLFRTFIKIIQNVTEFEELRSWESLRFKTMLIRIKLMCYSCEDKIKE